MRYVSHVTGWISNYKIIVKPTLKQYLIVSKEETLNSVLYSPLHRRPIYVMVSNGDDNRVTNIWTPVLEVCEQQHY